MRAWKEDAVEQVSEARPMKRRLPFQTLTFVTLAPALIACSSASKLPFDGDSHALNAEERATYKLIHAELNVMLRQKRARQKVCKM